MDRRQIGERRGEEMAGRARHLRAWWFRIAVLVVAIGFGALALLARTVWYFPIDLELTRTIQGARTPWLDGLLDGVSWVGFPPQSNIVFGAVILGLFLLGHRLEALMTAFAAGGSAGLWYLITPLVGRPRPSPELVDVAMQIPAGSFPSGHALNLTAIFGFLIYLTVLHVRPDLPRRLLEVLLALPILTIGFARVEDGAHWPSDVLGGYMLGGLWLVLTIQLYRWARHRRSGSHPKRAGDATAGLLGTRGTRTPASG
jgi:membrane-associated phospholipid phosphatase